MIDLVKHSARAEASGGGRQKAMDTGMALTLVCLLIGLATERKGWFVSAATLLVVAMTWPRLYAPAAKLWFGLSGLLGAVMSKLILSLVFFLVLTPTALIRRAMGKDSLRLRAFKAGSGSVFHERGGPFTPADLTTPF